MDKKQNDPEDVPSLEEIRKEGSENQPHVVKKRNRALRKVELDCDKRNSTASGTVQNTAGSLSKVYSSFAAIGMHSRLQHLRSGRTIHPIQMMTH